MKKIKIGIVGCGTIGLILAKAIESRLSKKTQLVAICDIDDTRIDNFLTRIKTKPYIGSLKELVDRSDFIIESASKDVSAEVARKALLANKDVLIMSVGGLFMDKNVLDLARKKRSHLHIPSGALAGLDGLKGASIAKIEKISLTTKKSPKALEGAPYLVKNNIDLSSLKEEKTIFEGSVGDAVNGFPKNVNVAAILGLVSSGLNQQKIHIKVVAVSGSGANIHELEVDGEFGRFVSRTENVPSPDNPKTSYLAALSAIATLEGALDNVRIGT